VWGGQAQRRTEQRASSLIVHVHLKNAVVFLRVTNEDERIAQLGGEVFLLRVRQIFTRLYARRE